MAKRILIIEDDPDILEILEIVFQDEGFDIESKRNGMSIDEIGLLHPDLILLDVRISGFEKTGAQLCAELKERAETGKIPVILLSAEAELAQIAKKCCADGHVSKPFDIPTLVNKLRELIP